MMIERGRPTRWTRRVGYLAGAVLVGVSAWAGISFPVPWSPFPLLMIIASTRLGGIDAGSQLVPLIGAIVFLLVAIPLLSARATAVWPSLALSGVLIAASVAFFAQSWSYGLRYHGLSYTVRLLVINICFAIAAVWLGLRAMRTRGYWTRYAATLVPCVWVAWCAFPWLGEWP